MAYHMCSLLATLSNLAPLDRTKRWCDPLCTHDSVILENHRSHKEIMCKTLYLLIIAIAVPVKSRERSNPC